MLLNGMGGVTLNNGTTLKHSEKYWFFISDDSDFFFDACFQCIHEILSVTTYRQKYFVHDILQLSCDTCLCTCIEQYTKKSCLEKNDPCFDSNWDGISFLSYFCFSYKAKILSNIININNELNCLNSNFLISKKTNYIYILCYYLVVSSFLKTSLLIHML